MTWRAALAALLVLLFAAPAVAQAQRPVVVEVSRDGAEWTATYRFPRAANAWFFPRSALTEHAPRRPWRLQSWQVATPGVRLERRGNYDVLVAEGRPVPMQVTVRFTPSSEVLVADYTPALVFSDGAVALFDQHFQALPAETPEAVAAMPIGLAEQPSNVRTIITFRDESGPVFHGGRRQAEVTSGERETYVLFGASQPLVTAAMAALIDPGLPEWLRTMLNEQTPAILARYAADLGPAPGGKPTLLATWMGPTAGMTSMNGGVIPSIVLMRFEGEGIVAESRALAESIRWFIAHEGAHFWLGQAVRYEHSRDAWITEGGADLLAIRTVAAIDPAYDARAALNRSLRECAGLIDNGPLAAAEERGEHRAYYACGAVIALAAEAKSGRPFSAFVRTLVDANRTDGVLSRDEWLASVGDEALRARIVEMLDRGFAEPGPGLAALLRAGGVAFDTSPDGVPVLR